MHLEKMESVLRVPFQIIQSFATVFFSNKSCSISPFSFIYRSFVGERSKVYRFSKISNSYIGNFSYISSFCSINNTRIGNFCSIASGVKAGMGMHPTTYVSSSPAFYSTKNALGYTLTSRNSFDEYKPITIGNDVWIGTDVVILDGVNIGDGAIIAAKSVVNKDVPPYAIVGGVPAKFIRLRFKENQIESLLKISWWNLSTQQLRERENLYNDVEAFIQSFNINLQP